MNYYGIAKTLLILGLIILVLSGVFFFLAKIIPGGLPGDIYIKKGNLRFYFPLATCLVLSLVLSLIAYFFRH